MKLFLNYRANNIQNRKYWELICDESFAMTLPITPYRYYNRAEVNAWYVPPSPSIGNRRNSQRVVEGIDALLIDTASVALMVESIGLGNSSWIEYLKRYSSSLPLDLTTHQRSRLQNVVYGQRPHNDLLWRHRFLWF